MRSYVSTKVKKNFSSTFASFLIFFHDLKSCMLCNVKRPDDVTTDELNPVGLWFAIPEWIHESNQFKQINSQQL